jgi:hypothetical protein
VFCPKIEIRPKVETFFALQKASIAVSNAVSKRRVSKKNSDERDDCGKTTRKRPVCLWG